MIVITCTSLPDVRVDELIEVRSDLIPPISPAQLLEKTGPNIIYTCRRTVDGGAWEGGEDERRKLLETAARAGAEYIDVELDLLEGGLLDLPDSVKVVASVHEMDSTPADLTSIVERLLSTQADVIKIAVMPETHDDCSRLLKLYKTVKKPAVFIAMGDMGFPTRVLGAKLGAAWTYAVPDGAEPPAPGMPLYSELNRLYHYNEITPDTLVYGVAGDPVSGSAGMKVFNSAFRDAGIDAIYLPLKSTDLNCLVKAYEPFGLVGLSVTHPLKGQAFELADNAANRAIANLEAVNTLQFEQDTWKGFAFDGPAAMSAITESGRLAGQSILLLGAGGAARAFGIYAAGCSANLTVASRTFEKSVSLAEMVGGKAVEWSERESVDARFVVNATPLGMYNNPDVSPMPVEYFREGMVAFDMVYNPVETRFLREAAAAGARVISGWEMYVRQATMQFRIWTGQEMQPPPRP